MKRKLSKLLPASVRSFWERLKVKFDIDGRQRYLENTRIEHILEDFRQGWGPGSLWMGIQNEQDLLAEVSLFKTADLRVAFRDGDLAAVKVYDLEAITETRGPECLEYAYHPDVREYLLEREWNIPAEHFRVLADHCSFDDWAIGRRRAQEPGSES